MASWSSSPHPISDVRDWKMLGRLELQPEFQRRSVWNLPAKIMLIDTVLSNIPMPKIFLSAILRNDNTHRIIIDGQQRITTILEFINDEFKLEAPYQGEHSGLKFSELPENARRIILKYNIDFSEISDADDDELREIYARVNKYTVALNKQELRKADFPGDFLKVSEELALSEFFEVSKIFSVANRRRFLDVEYTSELLIGLISGPSDKKKSLNNFYLDYKVWGEDSKNETIELFEKCLHELSIVSTVFEISRSRFKQKADFYSLFLAISEFAKDGHTLEGKELEGLTRDLAFLDEYIAPESHISELKNYAVKCISQANSSSSRRWRKDFLKAILNNSYKANVATQNEIRLLSKIVIEHDSYLYDIWSAEIKCRTCEEEIDFFETRFFASAGGDTTNLAEMSFFHATCNYPTDIHGYVVESLDVSDSELSLDSEQEELF